MGKKKLFWICVGIWIPLIIGFCFMFNSGIIFGYGCYVQKGVLYDQRIGYLDGCCDDCLILNVSVEEDVCGGHLFESKDKILYFANERILLNKSDGDELNIRWCWIRSIKDYRIRGVL